MVRVVGRRKKFDLAQLLKCGRKVKQIIDKKGGGDMTGKREENPQLRGKSLYTYEVESLFSSIICLCAEGPDAGIDVITAVLKEAEKGLKLCREDGIWSIKTI